MKLSRFLAVLIGIVLLIAGFAKVIAIDVFIQQINSFDLLTNRVAIEMLAWGLCILECLLGFALVVFYRPRVTLVFTGCLFVVFLVFTTWVWLVGGTQNCGCMGLLIERTPVETIIEDLFLVGAVIIAWRNA